MKIDKSIIFLIILGALIFVYFMLFYGTVNFELKDSVIRVNIHDTIDLKSYVLKVTNDKGKKLNKNISVDVLCSDTDEYKDGKLFIGDFSSKSVTYIVKYKFKTYKKTMDIIVISAPKDPDFRPNYDYKSTNTNEDDKPVVNSNSNLTDEQKKYIESLR